MNGTSMAAPQASGAAAVLLSAALAAGVPAPPARALRAIRAGARPVPGLLPCEQGAGLLQVDRAFEALVRMKDAPEERELRARIVNPTGVGGGIYERDVSTAAPFDRDVALSVVWPRSVANEARTAFERRLVVATDAPWIEVPPRVGLNADGGSLVVRIDARALSEGLHQALVTLSDPARPDDGPELTVPVTVVRAASADRTGHWRDELALQPGDRVSRFVRVPFGASKARVRATLKEGTRDTMTLALAALDAWRRQEERESDGRSDLVPGQASERSLDVLAGTVLEIALFSHWNQNGPAKVDLDLAVRGPGLARLVARGGSRRGRRPGPARVPAGVVPGAARGAGVAERRAPGGLPRGEGGRRGPPLRRRPSLGVDAALLDPPPSRRHRRGGPARDARARRAARGRALARARPRGPRRQEGGHRRLLHAGRAAGRALPRRVRDADLGARRRRRGPRGLRGPPCARGRLGHRLPDGRPRRRGHRRGRVGRPARRQRALDRDPAARPRGRQALRRLGRRDRARRAHAPVDPARGRPADRARRDHPGGRLRRARRGAQGPRGDGRRRPVRVGRRARGRLPPGREGPGDARRRPRARDPRPPPPGAPRGGPRRTRSPPTSRRSPSDSRRPSGASTRRRPTTGRVSGASSRCAPRSAGGTAKATEAAADLAEARFLLPESDTDLRALRVAWGLEKDGDLRDAWAAAKGLRDDLPTDFARATLVVDVLLRLGWHAVAAAELRAWPERFPSRASEGLAYAAKVRAGGGNPAPRTLEALSAGAP